MKFGIYSVFDSVSGLYGNPFIAVNECVAIRSYMEFVNNSYSGKDCALYKLGEFDNSVGITVHFEHPEFITNPVVSEAK